MKITILALHLGYGGIEKFISNIANMFIDNNDVEIISIYKLYDNPPFYINKNVKITYLLENLKPNRKEFYNSIKKFKLIEFIKQSYISLKILYLKRKKMIKAIKNINNGVVISTIFTHNKLLSKYGNKSVQKIATEHNYNYINKTYINKVIKSCNKLDYLVIASQKLSQMYNRNMKNLKCKVINIPLNVDFIPQKLSDLKEKNITYIGRLSSEKGINDLIHIFKKIYDKDNNIFLNIIGDGEEKEAIELKIKEYNLQNNIILHGYKKQNEIEKILLKTSIGINTSYTESFGLAVIETFSYGIPCVAFSSAEGLTEIIDNGKNGYIVNERNFEEMCNCVLELINNKEKREQMGVNARQKSLKYELTVIKEQWFNITKEYNKTNLIN